MTKTSLLRACAATVILLATPLIGGCGTVLVAGAATKATVGAGKLVVKTGVGAAKLTAKGAGAVVGLAEEQDQLFPPPEPGPENF